MTQFVKTSRKQMAKLAVEAFAIGWNEAGYLISPSVLAKARSMFWESIGAGEWDNYPLFLLLNDAYIQGGSFALLNHEEVAAGNTSGHFRGDDLRLRDKQVRMAGLLAQRVMECFHPEAGFEAVIEDINVPTAERFSPN